MLGANYGKTDANYQPAIIQLEIAGLEVPSAKVDSKKQRQRQNLPKTEPPLWQSHCLERIATGAPVISATQAYLKSLEWNGNENDGLHCQKVFGKGRLIEFYILNHQEHQPEFITNAAQQEIHDRYGVMEAKLHAVFASYAAKQNEPWKEPFDLLGSDLLKLLELHKGNKLRKPQKLRAIADLAHLVGTLGISIQWREGNLDLCIRERGLLWIVQVTEYGQQNLFGEIDLDNLYEVAITVLPGLWTRNFLNQTGSQEKTALYQYGFINQEAFRLDPHKQELAAALSLYLLQNRRAHPSGKYSIQTLLEAVLPLVEIEAIRRVKQYRSRFIKKFYSVLEALTDIGFSFRFSPSFPDALRPGWASLPHEAKGQLDPVATAPKDERLPVGFFDIWLNGVVSVTVPPDIESAIKEFERTKAETGKQLNSSSSPKSYYSPASNGGQFAQQPSQEPFAQPESLTGARVQQARLAMGMSQTELGCAIGRSQSWVRDLEHKQKDQAVSPKYAARLREVLKIS